jgi:hypothetical protein
LKFKNRAAIQQPEKATALGAPTPSVVYHNEQDSIMALVTITEIVKNPTLEMLVISLEIEDRENNRLWEAEADDGDYLPSCGRRLELLKSINGAPARSLADIQAKARATGLALELDAEAECTGPGSFIELSRSLIADMKAIGRADAMLHLVHNEPSAA